MSVLIVTSLGDIVIDLVTDRCPLTCKNFLKLCKIKYYNGCLFHKVQKDFIAQTGDRSGTGDGGESVYKFLYGDQARFFDDEIHPDLKHSKTGTVAMASAGKNCNASQFYFTLREDLDYLDGKHTVFGVVEEEEGLETLSRISEAYVDTEGRPFKDIRIKHTYVLDDPFPDPPQLAELIPDRSPEGKPDVETAEPRLEDDWVPMDETIGPAELEEKLRAREAHTNAAILESIGDIPDADIKPPENVLFVCKLNPVTQDEDLFTIFSRFGNVISADIIRDWKTGDSLCYAFIEFEAKESCEMAYFKMDNTLIDDRRIHVDFSQSVSRLWAKYRHGKKNRSNEEGGCFKCGAPDHIAKDCTQGQENKGQKYVLKESDGQRGGGDNQRYEMVFEGDTMDEGLKRQKTDKHHRQISPERREDEVRRLPRDVEREREKERGRYRGRDRDGGRNRDSEITPDREREQNKDGDADRDGFRERVKDRSRDREREKNRDENADTNGFRERDKGRGRDRERTQDGERYKNRDGDVDKVGYRDRDGDKHRARTREEERDKSRDRDADRDGYRGRGRERERERDKEQGRTTDRDQHRSYEREEDRTRHGRQGRDDDRERSSRVEKRR
ncbi:cyclophilin 59 [Wolffia australiana]